MPKAHPRSDIEPPGMGLTYISKSAYRSLLRDATLTPQELYDRYGVSWRFRLQGAICAIATRNTHDEMRAHGEGTHSADELYRWVMTYQSNIFELNGLEDVKPGKHTFEMMVYSMCQAETGDYGEDDCE